MIAETIACVASHDDSNILHIISIINVRSRFLYLVSTILVWKALPSTEKGRSNGSIVYSARKPETVVDLVCDIQEEKDEERRFTRMEIFLRALSTYLALASPKHPHNRDGQLSTEFLDDLRGKMKDWIKMIKIHTMKSQHGNRCIAVGNWK